MIMHVALGFVMQVGARPDERVDRLSGRRRRRHWGDGVTVDDRATQTNVEAALAGDGEAFALLFREYQRDVHRVCLRMLGDSQSAEDAVSEVFLRARRALAAFDPKRPFRPWLMAIAGHHCIDQLRRRSAEARVFSGSEPPESELASPGPSPLGRLMAAEQRQALGRAIAALPLRYRLPLLLHYFDDLDYDAIAVSLEVTRNQVGTLLFRAKRLLREQVESEASGPATRRRGHAWATKAMPGARSRGRKR